MPLTRDQLEARAVRDYFLKVNDRDFDAIMATFAPDCVMTIPTSGFEYRGHDALAKHFRDFLATFPKVEFSNFEVTADETTQRVAARFTVALTGQDGVTTVLNNCNFFQAAPDGRFRHIVIYTSQPVKAGFEAGSD
ncbi:MAG: nuclear transport factor 2 family protein [Sphingomonadaceae bacterium]